VLGYVVLYQYACRRSFVRPIISHRDRWSI
jgi:hypothetical protein